VFEPWCDRGDKPDCPGRPGPPSGRSGIEGPRPGGRAKDSLAVRHFVRLIDPTPGQFDQVVPCVSHAAGPVLASHASLLGPADTCQLFNLRGHRSSTRWSRIPIARALPSRDNRADCARPHTCRKARRVSEARQREAALQAGRRMIARGDRTAYRVRTAEDGRWTSTPCRGYRWRRRGVGRCWMRRGRP
jgi:hypothetical protein